MTDGWTRGPRWLIVAVIVGVVACTIVGVLTGLLVMVSPTHHSTPATSR